MGVLVSQSVGPVPLAPTPFPRAVLVTVIAFAPLAIGWVYKEYVHPRPFWCHYYDPESIYYHAAQELARGQLPRNLDNPGTPVQMAGLGILAVTGNDPLAYSSFLAVAHPLAALLSFAAGLLLARRVFAGLPLPLQVAGLWVYFLCPQSLEYDNVWSPETFYFPVGSLFLVGLWDLARQETGARRLWTAGLALGLCCSVKLTFVAWVPAFLLALAVGNGVSTHGRLFRVGHGLAPTAGGFFLATLPVIAGYPYLVAWVWRLATHSGPYGYGPAAPPNLADTLANWRVVLESAKGWWLLFAVCLLVVLWSAARRAKQAGAAADGRLFLLTFALAALAASFVLVSRQVALRYLLPCSRSPSDTPCRNVPSGCNSSS
jgi:hypothetical protein